MSNFKIEKGIEIHSNRLSYPFPHMEIGDSFWAQGPEGRKASVAARAWGKVNNARFTTRKEGDGVRIWRVE